MIAIQNPEFVITVHIVGQIFSVCHFAVNYKLKISIWFRHCSWPGPVNIRTIRENILQGQFSKCLDLTLEYQKRSDIQPVNDFVSSNYYSMHWINIFLCCEIAFQYYQFSKTCSLHFVNSLSDNVSLVSFLFSNCYLNIF